MYLSIPYHLLVTILRLPFFPKNDNPFTRRSKYNSGIKKGAFAKEYKVEDIKRKSKEHNVTFNDLVMTAISMTIKQYFIR